MTDDRIRFERRGDHTALLTFDRPDRLNALDSAALARLHVLIGELADDRAIRAVVLTGAGTAFSAGADLKAWAAGPPAAHPVRDAHRELHLFQDITRRIVNHPAVFIAAINGVAVGIGAEIAIAADLRLGAPSAELMLSEVKRGLFQTNGVLHLLPRLVGHGRATRWILTGERVPAGALLDAGFLSEVVAPDRLLARAFELADTIAANAPISVRLGKRLLHRTWEVDLETMLQLEIDGMLACMASDDIEEGIRAFVEKRAPRWEGR